MRQSISTLLLVLLPLTVGLSACDSGGNGGESDVDNQFSFTIEPSSSGSAAVEQQEEVSGFSFFVDTENPESGEEAFAIYLNNEDSFSEADATKGLFGWVARSSSRPGTGDYAFNSEPTDAQFGAVLWTERDASDAPFYVIDAGTISLSESSDETVSGSIDASGTKLTFTSTGVTQEPVTLTGSFTAEDIDTFVPLSSPTP